jgi:signal transduction histidine kinase
VSATKLTPAEAANAMLGDMRKVEAPIGRPLRVVLDALCRRFDTTLEGHCSSVLLPDRTRTRVRYAVGPNLPSSYRELLKGHQVRCFEAPAGVAVMQKTPTSISPVLYSGQENQGGLPQDAAHGFRLSWSLPILSLTGEFLGIFAIYLRDGSRPTPLPPGLLQQCAHIVSVVIERSRNAEVLKRSEALLRKTQQLSSTGSFSWRPATDEIVGSEELYRIFELDTSVPLTLELIFTRVHSEDGPLFNEMINRARGGSDFEFEHRLQMLDHSVKYVRSVAHGTLDEDGQLDYIGVIQDVTPRWLSEEALGKARTELARVARVSSLGALTASIAHEVSQPLSGIVTNCSACLHMLAADPPDLEGARETARRTIRDGQRAADVIRRVRALFGKKSEPRESVDLNEATQEVIALRLSELQRAGAVLRFDLAEDLPPVRGDRVQLQQVILNLLLNACEAMRDVDDRPRRLVISTEREEGDGVRLRVRDAGVGFEPRDLKRLFEAFYTTKIDGMGIGLSVSRSIIERHHGRLWAELNDGPGATFSFSIPREPAGDCGAQDRSAKRIPAMTPA